jgi:anti-sigma factor RsiW
MNGNHLSAEELQQYVLDRGACTTESILHVGACPDCQADIAAYSVLMGSLRQQPKPAFDFDVAAAVMERLERQPGRKALPFGNKTRPFGYMMAALILLMTGIPAWLFRKSAYFVFTEIQAVFLYPILVAAGLIMLLRILHLYKKYQQIFNIINK